MRAWIVMLGVAIALGGCARASKQPAVPPPPVASEVQWTTWRTDAFTRAHAERRIILINVVATWCHWCHVMEETTYADPRVAAILRDHFVTIRVDSDARPDLAERYRAWGWPATAVLTPDAQPVTNLRGYRNPETFAALLTKLVTARDAGTLGADGPGLDIDGDRDGDHPRDRDRAADSDLDRARALAAAQMDAYFDEQDAGWGDIQKYPWPAPIEHAFVRARVRDESEWRARALATLQAERALIDPVWGGMYQYSVGRVWTRPHYEKIAMIQAGAIETYAIAARVTGDPQWLEPARDVARYVLGPMQDPQGGFYTSQDADLRRPDAAPIPGADYYAKGDADRRALGVPRIDTEIYADLNGATIIALLELHRASDDADARAAAIAAAERLLRTHRTRAGAFRHASHDPPDAPLHLADQAAMGRALVALYDTTDDPRWLVAARALADFALARLWQRGGAFFAHTEDPHAVGVFAQRRQPLEENGTCARFLLELHRRLDLDDADSPYLLAARSAIAALGQRSRLQAEGKIVGRYLLAAELLLASAVDITIVGAPDDPRMIALWRAARATFEPRATIRTSRPGERYPAIGPAAAYLCTATACSPPITTPDRVAPAIAALFADSR